MRLGIPINYNMDYAQMNTGLHRATSQDYYFSPNGLPSLSRVPSTDLMPYSYIENGLPITSPTSIFVTQRQNHNHIFEQFPFPMQERVFIEPNRKQSPKRTALHKVLSGVEPTALCKIFQYLTLSDKAYYCQLVCRSWKLSIFNPLSHSCVTLNFKRRFDSVLAIRFSPVLFRLKLLVICSPALANPRALVALLKHLQSVRACWLYVHSKVAEIDETFVISLLQTIGRSLEMLRLEIFSKSITQAISTHAKHLRQLIVANWTYHSSLLGHLDVLGLKIPALKSIAINVDDGTSLHPSLILLHETSLTVHYITLQFTKKINGIVKGLHIVDSTDGRTKDGWAIYENALIEHLRISAQYTAIKGRTLLVELCVPKKCDHLIQFVKRIQSALTMSYIRIFIKLL